MARPAFPSSVEAETNVIGCILIHPQSLSHVIEHARPEDFYHPALRVIYEAMLELDRIGRPIDCVTVVEQLKNSDTFDRLNTFRGAEYLTEIMGSVVAIGGDHVAYHAKLVRAKATARRMVAVGSEIVETGLRDVDPEEYIEESERAVFEVRAQLGSTYYQAKPVLREVLRSIETRFEKKETLTGVPTGFGKLDELTSGLQPGDLVLMAARPSMGKTAAMLKVVYDAVVQGIPALVFSAEMSRHAIFERVLASEAHITSQNLRVGSLGQRDWIMLQKTASALAESPFFIDDGGAPTMSEIRAKGRRWRHDPKAWGPETKQGLIAVDYIQLLTGRDPKQPREREVSEISRGMKSLAKELGVPILALSQLNRSLESRADKRPMMSDLRESGALEQDADVIIFLYRDEVYSKEDCKEPGIAELIVAKQRNGPTGVVRSRWLGSYARFEDLSDRS